MYHYETLGDERFQQLCQALISANFPNIQCLPVGQPDGGRDAYLIRRALRQSKSTKKEVIVFQVKFVKSPADSGTEREMIEALVKQEEPRVERLKSHELVKYYFITNLKGTSHINSGSIDRVNNQLSSLLGVESYCCWRDDIDRRLDNNFSVR